MELEILNNKNFLIWLIFGAINILSLFYVYSDKRKATKRHKRTPEIDFFLWGVFGGSLGILIGMYVFRHKTRKWYFVFGFSFLLLQNLLTIDKIIEVFVNINK